MILPCFEQIICCFRLGYRLAVHFVPQKYTVSRTEVRYFDVARKSCGNRPITVKNIKPKQEVSTCL
jgi:hypothetical protein